MDLIARLDAVRARRDVLAHPFYQRWSEGELSSSELAFYAGQYAHAVDALAAASRHAEDVAPAATLQAIVTGRAVQNRVDENSASHLNAVVPSHRRHDDARVHSAT